MGVLLAFLLFAVLLVIGVPVGTALGISAVVTTVLFDPGNIPSLGVNFSSTIASFPLLAIPFFVLSGVILQRAGLAAHIARLFELLAGRATGGLAIVSVLTCMFWGALSGSGPATTAAVGLILLAPMIKQGYDKHFAGALLATSSDLSIIIPPSIAFIIYGNLTHTSVPALFAAGVVPGILAGAGLMVCAYILSRKNQYGGLKDRGSLGEVLGALRKASWALVSPVIILGGIYGGFFTPTEAAAVAVVYSLVVALLVYRSVKVNELVPIFVEACVTSSVIMYLVAFAGLFTLAMDRLGAIDSVAQFVISISGNKFAMIMAMNLLLLALGMFLDAISISYLVMPLLLPVLHEFGIDPVWYGVIFITALAIGQATPPVGVNLFTAANLLNTEIDSVARRAIPFVVANVIVLVLLSLFPALSLYLPIKFGLCTP